MNTFNKSVVLVTVSAVLVAVPNFSAYGQAEIDSVNLLPLEPRSVTIETDSNRYESVADEINASTQSDMRGSSETPNNSYPGFFDRFVDGDGDVNLPLGLSVFSTMGDPSIGISSDL